ncbi:MAG: polysaccharide deacetylase family protein [Hyphomicrobiales bacterium]
MATWTDLHTELDAWAKAGLSASVWWRDDDAGMPHPNLERLLDTAEAANAPIHMATIPAELSDEVQALFAQKPHVHVLQHGYSHTDYAPKGKGSWELGTHRPMDVVLEEQSRGIKILRAAFGDQFSPVQTPPWTRIAPEVLVRLPEIGFLGLSMVFPREQKYAVPGLLEANTRCDPIKWKGGAHFAGTERALDDVVTHLQGRRTGMLDAGEPTGLLTHHKDHDEDIWGFVEELSTHLNAHPATHWVTFKDLLEDDT